jgi:hypothetical protein
MDKLIDFLKELARKKFYGTIEIKMEAGIPVLCRKIIENVKI